jgi:hypothetical protein
LGADAEVDLADFFVDIFYSLPTPQNQALPQPLRGRLRRAKPKTPNTQIPKTTFLSSFGRTLLGFPLQSVKASSVWYYNLYRKFWSGNFFEKHLISLGKKLKKIR